MPASDGPTGWAAPTTPGITWQLTQAYCCRASLQRRSSRIGTQAQRVIVDVQGSGHSGRITDHKLVAAGSRGTHTCYSISIDVDGMGSAAIPDPAPGTAGSVGIGAVQQDIIAYIDGIAGTACPCCILYTGHRCGGTTKSQSERIPVDSTAG